MEPIVIQATILALGGVTSAIITALLKTKYDEFRASKKKATEESIQESDTENMLIVQEWLDQFREQYNFDRASIFQFHNGGKFFQGKSMKKFSMSYESVSPGYEKIRRTQQNILASDYPRWINKMLKSRCFSTLTSEMDPRDRYDLEMLGIQQFVTVPIHCLRGNLIGFIVGYNIGDVDQKVEENFEELVEESKFISGYLTQSIR
jgi:hypothetical protein